ncbi:GNAT family N-acetyltransferase [Crenobacter cavernae]|uniref:GNAT family N-acetyltransferase n=1 Tax=Crenobacter cavernae TaxID=2290923 RepID=A0ABY0FH52_9NEIS|nr:GNAT family N-acetyltransferase [Crenobacter cavernae]RXZ44593.1 GNAT family N-acetyltransferase [Crenobacter cavernae]
MTPYPVTVREAHLQDADTVADLVLALMAEICARTELRHSAFDVAENRRSCRERLVGGDCRALIAESAGRAVGVATLASAEGVGVVQECYVRPEWRSHGVGQRLLCEAQTLGRADGWHALEVTTPPLPAFARSFAFYQANGLAPVAGRKMRRMLD